MKTFLRGALPAAVFAAVLSLPGGEAQARDECGTLSSGAATCSDAAYASGIRYDAAGGWGNGIAGDVALTVTGGSSTAITLPTATGWGSGIVVRTAEQPGTTGSRTIDLRVGSGTNAVTITQSTNTNTDGFDNTGVAIHQRGKAADATTVTLGSGVRIGTSTAPVRRSGVHVLVENGDNTATQTITSAATIHSRQFGLLMDNRGSGNSVITNTGSITTTAAIANDYNAFDKAGIRVLDWRHNPGGDSLGGRDRTADTTTTVTNSGSITVSATSVHGIHVQAEGRGLYRVVHSGAGDDGGIAASGANGYGIHVDAAWHRGVPTADAMATPTAAATDAVKIESSGDITVEGAGGRGISVFTAASAADVGTQAVASNTHIEVVTTGGTISATGTSSVGIFVLSDVVGDTTDKITNAAAINSKQYGIWLDSRGPGDAMVENSGALTVDGANTPNGIEGTGIAVVDSGAGAVAVANSGAIDATGHGILVRKTGSAGAVTVTHSAGAVVGKGRTGVTAEIGNTGARGNTSNLTVDVTGGSVTASATRSQVAVHATTWGTGSVAVTVGKDATLNARNNVGVFAVIEDNANNTAGQVSVTQGGTVSAASGVYALVTPASASGASRAADAQPLIDITWTGSFRPPTGTATAVQANDLSHALALGHELAAVGILPRIAGGAGILAEAMSWRTASYRVARADMPTIADTARADAILAAAEPDDMSTDEARADYALRTAVLAEIGEALAGTAYTIPGVDTSDIDTDNNDALSAAEIATWLGARDDRHTVMRQALEYAFTDEEAAVLEALAEGSGLEAALDALETAVGGTLPADYRRDVTAFAGYHNVGNIRIRVNGGSIDSASDGVRALYALPDLRNGAIELTVAQGAEVTGGAAGVYVANAGRGSDGILKQHVTVHGEVTGGTDAAVHLAGGGKLTVGRTGRVLAGSSGRAVLVNDPGPAEITVNGLVRGGLVRGGQGARAAVDLTGGGTVTVGLTGKVEAGGATLAIRGDPDADIETTVEIHVDNKTYAAGIHKGNARQLLAARVDGGIVAPGGGVKFVDAPDARDRWSGLSTTVPTGSNGVIDVEGLRDAPAEESTERQTPPPTTEMQTPPRPSTEMRRPPIETRPQPTRTIECDALRKGGNNKCGLYEALPSALLAMNTLSSRDDRLSAARDANGGWALVEGASSEWKAASATQPGVAYDLRRYGMRAGVELASGEGLRVGVSAHHLRGNAKMESAGEIEISGAGAGVNAAFSDDDGFYADAQAAVTWFDAELSSAADGMLKRDANGFGYAMGLEAGKRIDVSGDLSVTPRAALAWSNASLDTFADNVGAGTFVSVEEAQALTGRAGVRVEAAPSGADGVRLFGALDVSHLLSQGAEAQVVDKAMKTTSEETGLRAGVGASWSGGEGLSLQGAAHYAASGGDNSGFGGSLSLALRF